MFKEPSYCNTQRRYWFIQMRHFVATSWLNYVKRAISDYRNSPIILTNQHLLSLATNNVFTLNQLENLTLEKI